MCPGKYHSIIWIAAATISLNSVSFIIRHLFIYWNAYLSYKHYSNLGSKSGSVMAVLCSIKKQIPTTSVLHLYTAVAQLPANMKNNKITV
jgi:hypothetical protein